MFKLSFCGPQADGFSDIIGLVTTASLCSIMASLIFRFKHGNFTLAQGIKSLNSGQALKLSIV